MNASGLDEQVTAGLRRLLLDILTLPGAADANVPTQAALVSWPIWICS